MMTLKTGLAQVLEQMSNAVLVGAVALTMMAGPVLAQSDDAAEVCLSVAGAPNSGAPVSRDAASSFFGTLAKARPHCEAAVIGVDPDPTALFHLAVIMQREGAHDRALKVFNLAADAGLAAAHTKLGDYYNFGIGGVREDHRRAVEHYQQGVAGGDLPAQATLAIMHQIGRGVPQDFDKMLMLLTESAEGGYHFSQLRLAELYMSPQSVPGSMAEALDLPDPIKAAEFYELAAAQGNAKARAELDKFASGEGLFDDPRVKLKWLQKAADRGEAAALNSLGLLYETGDGVDYDPAQAASLYVQALETGDLPIQKLRVATGRYPPRWDRETAIEFQLILQERGLYLGAIDAVVGPGTMGAAARLAQAQ